MNKAVKFIFCFILVLTSTACSSKDETIASQANTDSIAQELEYVEYSGKGELKQFLIQNLATTIDSEHQADLDREVNSFLENTLYPEWAVSEYYSTVGDILNPNYENKYKVDYQITDSEQALGKEVDGNPYLKWEQELIFSIRREVLPKFPEAPNKYLHIRLRPEEA